MKTYITTVFNLYQLSAKPKTHPQARSAPNREGTILHLTILIEIINYQPNKRHYPLAKSAPNGEETILIPNHITFNHFHSLYRLK